MGKIHTFLDGSPTIFIADLPCYRHRMFCISLAAQRLAYEYDKNKEPIREAAPSVMN